MSEYGRFLGYLQKKNKGGLTLTDREEELDFFTTEQRNRDQFITRLFQSFVRSYESKSAFSDRAKTLILRFTIAWISIMLVSCLLATRSFILAGGRSFADISALLSAVLPFVAAIIGTLNIVTRYVFPADEEKYITEIVKSVQQYDLENKRLNMRVHGRSEEPALNDAGGIAHLEPDLMNL